MKKISYLLSAVAGVACAATAFGANHDIVKTDAYRWTGDTIYQNEFKAWADSPYQIRSTYKGRPGYFMPIAQQWTRKNDLSAYPVLKSGNLLHEALYNMALDEMANAVEPDTTLRTGKEWAGVWTRDVSYSIILSMAYMQPEASKISLMKKVNASGQIIQDTGSGGAWPISTDRLVWIVAAYEIYKVTGDKDWLRQVYPISVRSLDKDAETTLGHSGIKGETSFIDWREQSYPRWMQTVDISQSEAFGTNMVYIAALRAVSKMAAQLGDKSEATRFNEFADAITCNVDDQFWMEDKGYYGMYTYGRDRKMLNPRAETLGLSLSILFDIATPEKQKQISENNPITPFGPAIFYPQIADMPSYHNNALWPFVASYWALAEAKVGNEQGFLEGLGSVYRPAALFCTNKENFNLDNGDIYTELNSSNMLWSLSGNIALTTRGLFGIHFEEDGLLIKPFVPEILAGNRTLDNFKYRNATISITVNGFGNSVKTITLNGKALDPTKVISAKQLNGNCKIVVEMDNQPIPEMAVNHVNNVKAPLTPIARLSNDPELNGEGVPVNNLLQWNPIEYIARYEVYYNGEKVADTRETSYPALQPGEWQVIGVAGDGTQSFASEPLSNRPATIYQFEKETTAVSSSEVSYMPNESIVGYTGAGFVETDKSRGAVKVKVEIPEDGVYTFALRYANGNGPVNTENKAAIRTMTLNGQIMGTWVLPQRGVGNWNDWGMSNVITQPLEKGIFEIGIEYLPQDENMNISTNHALLDHLRIERAE
jgi:hypothetical protein